MRLPLTWSRIAACALAVPVLLLVSCGDTEPSGEQASTVDSDFALTGMVKLDSDGARSSIYPTGEPYENPSCSLDGWNRDIVMGSPITVYDERSTVIGTGQVVSIEWTDLVTREMTVNDQTFLKTDGPCLVTFEVANLPAADFYSVDLAGRRAKSSYSFAELDSKDWIVSIELVERQR